MTKIVAIDDNQDNLLVLRAIIRNLMPDCTLFTALTGTDGLKIVEQESPDTILLDIKMPVMNGFEVCQRLRANSRTKHIPIIMLTAVHKDADSKARGLQAGADAFLTKPVEEIELVAQIRAMLRIKKAEDHLRMEKKLLASALMESESRYHKLFEDSQDAVFISSRAGKLLDVNPAMLDLFGYALDEMLTINAARLYRDPNTRKQYQEIIEREGAVKDYEITMQRKDGKMIDCQLTSSLIKNPDGSILGYHGFIRDITRRKQSEKQLAESEKRFRDIAGSSGDWFWEVDLEGRYTYASGRIEQVLGYVPEEIIGITPFDLMPPDEVERVAGLFQKAVAEKKNIVDLENWNLAKDGTRVCLLTNAVPLLNEQGDLLGYRGVDKDITGQKHHAEKQLRLQTNLEKLWALSKMADQPVQILCNHVLEQIIQMTKSRYGFYGFLNNDESIMTIHSWSIDVLQECKMENKPIVYPIEKAGIWAEAIRTRKPRIINDYLQDIPAKKGLPDGHVALTRVLLVPVLNEGRVIALGAVANKETDYDRNDLKTIHGFMTNAQLIIDRKLKEQEKEELETHLQQAYKMEAIGTMAGGIAHDFNNILAIILSGAEMVHDDLEKESDSWRYLDHVIMAAHRARDLVKQILVFSRQAKQEFIPIQPQFIVKEYLKLMRSTIPTSIKIRQNIQDCGYIDADPSQIQQVIMNLCVNAVHAMDEEGLLEVGMEQITLAEADIKMSPGIAPGPYVKLWVSDNGIGMDKETMAHIFDPFFTTKELGEGTGMGLAVVHGIVTKHGGMITVDSEPGRGTTFHIFFPAIEGEEKINEPETNEALPRGTERILFVDDEALLAETGSMLLQRQGYKVTVKSSSTEALAYFRANPEQVDLIITDQTMPDLTGCQLATEVFKIRPDLPIILCTGYSKKVSEEKILNMGIKELILKPVDKEKLASSVRRALDENKPRKQQS